MLPTTGSGTAGTLARQAIDNGADLILGAGGDGTLNEILSGMVHSRVPLGVLPAGTANVLAREIGLGCSMGRAARLLGDCVAHRVSAGLLRMEGASRHFLLMAGIGFDAHIVYNLDTSLKGKLGQLAYWRAALKEVGRELEEFEAQSDGRSFRTSFALASRVRNYAGYLEVAHNASLLADDFEVALFEGRSTMRYLTRYLPAVAARRQRVPGIDFLRARRMSFSAAADESVYIQVDGEYAGRLPASVEIVPDAITLLTPPSFSESH